MNSLNNFGKIFDDLCGLAQAPSRTPLDPAAQAAALLAPLLSSLLPCGCVLCQAPSWCLEALLRLCLLVGLRAYSASKVEVPPPSAEHSLSRAGPGSAPGRLLGMALPPRHLPAPASLPHPPHFSSGSTLNLLSGLWLSSLIFLDYGFVPLHLPVLAPPPGRPAWIPLSPHLHGYLSRPSGSGSAPSSSDFPLPASRAETPPLRAWSPPLFPALEGFWMLQHCPGPGSVGDRGTAEHYAVPGGPEAEPLQGALPAGAEPQGGGAQWAEAG